MSASGGINRWHGFGTGASKSYGTFVLSTNSNWKRENTRLDKELEDQKNLTGAGWGYRYLSLDVTHLVCQRFLLKMQRQRVAVCRGWPGRLQPPPSGTSDISFPMGC